MINHTHLLAEAQAQLLGLGSYTDPAGGVGEVALVQTASEVLLALVVSEDSVDSAAQSEPHLLLLRSLRLLSCHQHRHPQSR